MSSSKIAISDLNELLKAVKFSIFIQEKLKVYDYINLDLYVVLDISSNVNQFLQES